MEDIRRRWFASEIAEELRFFSKVTGKDDLTDDDWFSLWERSNLLWDLREATDGESKRFRYFLDLMASKLDIPVYR